MGSCYSSSVGKKTRSNGENLGVEEVSKNLGVEEVSNHTSATTAAETHRRNKKKSSKKNKSACDVDESVLRHIPGRIFTNDASKIASLYTQQGKKGTNQDAMLLWENFSSSNDTVFCGVFDGHGPFGHMVAKRVRDSLPLLLCSQWKASSKGEESSIDKTGNNLTSTNSEETVSLNTEDEPYDSLEVEEAEKLPEIHLPLKRALLKAFKLMDKELKFHPTIDCFCSGTTAVTLIKQGQDIVISNVGDSRAVLATRDKDDTLLAVQLTVDLKPDLPREAARIQQCKGRIFALQDEPEVARVWLPNNDSPGLAMARAFGDFCLKDFGLISVPDVYYHRLTERDEFIILATDGIWDVLSNKEAVDIVASAPGRSMASRALVECAVRAWRLKYPTSKNDDCAAVCLFLDHSVNVASEEGNNRQISLESIVNVAETNKNTGKFGVPDGSDALVQEHSGTIKSCDEIVPISELEKPSVKYQGQPKRSLAECISTADDEWSALEGITRVNSLVSLPRLLSSDSRTNSWRKWLS